MSILPSNASNFLEAIEIEQNLSPNIIASYKCNLKQFYTWLADNDLPAVMEELKPLVIRDYIVFLKTEANISNNSIKQKVASLKSFFNYLSDLYPGISVPNIPKHIKKERKTIIIISREQVYQLLNAVEIRRLEIEAKLAKKTRYFKRLKKQYLNCKRDLTIISLLIGTGMRIAELTTINLADINFPEKTIVIHGKRNKIREVFFDTPSIESALTDYYNWRVSQDFIHSALFVNSKDYGGITPRSVQRLLKDYLKIAGLATTITPHSLRHSYASISIENGANIKVISQLLGHSHVGTTLEFYTHLSKEYLRLVYQETHPTTDHNISLEQAMKNRKEIITTL